MKLKLLVFDVDGTIAAPSRPVTKEVAEKIRSLEERGCRIAFASGKNIAYLTGLARGIGLQAPLLIGENGCVIFDPLLMKEIRLAERPIEFAVLEAEIIQCFNDTVWIQPNQVELTIFPKTKGEMPALVSLLRELTSPLLEKIVVWEHIDAIDILPVGVDKGKALAALRTAYDLDKDMVVAVGDGKTDIPMANECESLFLVGNQEIGSENDHLRRFPTVSDVLVYMESLL
ncbi:HAD family hydrolase [Methyloglobulus sp.]|uniref:HAD family hydrolase n=1 Tax=Methyloglobulus sp. TaxID=2518622 RepID=UPI0039897655